jgi:hypothetical protein
LSILSTEISREEKYRSSQAQTCDKIQKLLMADRSAGCHFEAGGVMMGLMVERTMMAAIFDTFSGDFTKNVKKCRENPAKFSTS